MKASAGSVRVALRYVLCIISREVFLWAECSKNHRIQAFSTEVVDTYLEMCYIRKQHKYVDRE